jgi:membrane carboxypeptidase/penicillin-binding protein PbpC
VTDRDGRLLHVSLSEDGEWLVPETLAGAGKWLPLVAVSIEDRRFRSHPGVDPLAIARALAQNAAGLRTVSGASTVTQQLVRLAEPRPRNLLSKYLEFWKALKLERALSKDEILELYLNRAPFGGNLRGAGAAARAYFGKRPADLSLGEATLLVAILRGPSLYRPDRHPERARERRDFLLGLLLERGVISREEHSAARLERVPGARLPLPRENPLLAAWLLAPGGYDAEGGDGAVRPAAGSPFPAPGSAVPAAGRPAGGRRWRWGAPGFRGLAAALDSPLQLELESRLARALAPFPPEVTGAGAILDNASGEVLAYVGNARPGGPHGSVDCARARRSPGSALKPFLFLRAFAGGDLHPASLLADTPAGFAGLSPRNFDRGHRGPVTARRALADSLNVPAVRVLRRVGTAETLRTLTSLGFSIPARGDYGDSLILGGVEVTLMELLRAYGTLARGGRDLPYTLVPARPAGQGAAGPGADGPASSAPWLAHPAPAPSGAARAGPSPQGAVAESRSQAGRGPEAPPPPPAAPAEGGPAGAGAGDGDGDGRLFSEAAAWLVNSSLVDDSRLPAGSRGLARPFKTGTSHGFRDAWLAMYSRSHTLVLWLGDPSGAGHEGLSGLAALGPAAADVFRALGEGRDSGYAAIPTGIARFMACPISGEPAGPDCPDAVPAYRLAAAARSRPCRLHFHRAGEILTAWPGDLRPFMNAGLAAGRPGSARPAGGAPGEAALRVVSPIPGMTYVLSRQSRSVPLKAEGAVGRLFWFVDGVFLREEAGSTPFLDLSPGEHAVSAIDDANVAARSVFKVEAAELPVTGEGPEILRF